MAVEHRHIETPVSTKVVTHSAPVAAVDRTNATAYDPYSSLRQTSYRLVQAICLVFGIIEAPIAIRVVLRALGANPEAGFAQFIYGLSAPLVAPFAALFDNPQYSGSVLEVHSIVALVVYALLAWLVARLTWLLFAETRSVVATTAASVETRNSVPR